MASQQDIARHLGLSQGWVSKLVTDGVLPQAERGEYDLDRARLAYIRYERGRIAVRGAERIGAAKELEHAPGHCPVCNKPNAD